VWYARASIDLAPLTYQRTPPLSGRCTGDSPVAGLEVNPVRRRTGEQPRAPPDPAEEPERPGIRLIGQAHSGRDRRGRLLRMTGDGRARKSHPRRQV